MDNRPALPLCLCPLGLLAPQTRQPIWRRSHSRPIWPNLPPVLGLNREMTGTKLAPKLSVPQICRQGLKFGFGNDLVLIRGNNGEEYQWSSFGTSFQSAKRNSEFQPWVEICRKIKAWNMKITPQKIQSKLSSIWRPCLMSTARTSVSGTTWATNNCNNAPWSKNTHTKHSKPSRIS